MITFFRITETKVYDCACVRERECRCKKGVSGEAKCVPSVIVSCIPVILSAWDTATCLTSSNARTRTGVGDWG